MTEKTAKHILVVDDDITLVEVLSRALTRRGFSVRCANNFDQAQTAINAATAHYAIVDLKLGDHSGLQLIPLLTASNPDMRILILTGYSSIATTVEAMRLGAFNYLCKPAGTEEIIAALQNVKANPGIDIATNPPSINRLEWEHIHRVLQENDNNISATARALGMHRRTLQRKLSKRPVHK
jgi:two-component system response regulator RegA